LELIKLLKDVSPMIWESILKQVYVEAYNDLMWSVLWFSLFGVLLRFKIQIVEYINEDVEYALEDLAKFFYVLLLVVSPLIAFALVGGALKQFANPEFYAIRYLINSIGG